MVGRIMGKKSFEITGTGLKLIAVITMFIDHIGAGLLEVWLTNNASVISQELYDKVFLVDAVLRSIGRMAFPIYCYMLVEGFIHTRNLKKYAIRLLTIAVISEVPFDYLFRRSFFDLNYNNVLWTLLLGLGVLYAYSLIDGLDINVYAIYACRILVMFAGMGIAYFAHLDYKMAGVTCISVMYYLNGPTKKQRLVSFGMGVLMLTLMSSVLEVFAFLMLIPVSCYYGKRGADSVALRRFFYLFYPAHIILLGLVAFVLKI